MESKIGKSECQKLFKSKKLLKSSNSPKFNAKENEPSFLTPKARAIFIRLRLAFTKAPILYHFNLEFYIWIETDALGYAISDVLSQLTSETRSD